MCDNEQPTTQNILVLQKNNENHPQNHINYIQIMNKNIQDRFRLLGDAKESIREKKTNLKNWGNKMQSLLVKMDSQKEILKNFNSWKTKSHDRVEEKFQEYISCTEEREKNRLRPSRYSSVFGDAEEESGFEILKTKDVQSLLLQQ